jgi:hypothetical protein
MHVQTLANAGSLAPLSRLRLPVSPPEHKNLSRITNARPAVIRRIFQIDLKISS